MRTAKFILPALLLHIIALSSCRKERFGIWGKGSNVTEVRDITGFSGIDLSMNAEVYYQQDSVYWVEVNAQPNILPYIETEVQGNVLKIDCRPALHRHNNITLIVHSPAINLLHVSGSGDINVPNSISTGSMEVTVSGSGNVSVYSVLAKDLACTISGSGNVDLLGGSVDNENFRISGSGNIDALGTVSVSSEVSISGSGDVSLYTEKYLKVSISGSGSVKYKGYPSVDAHISGSGNVTHIH